MCRVACLFIPDLPLAAALRAEPELRGKPLAITDSAKWGRNTTIISGWLCGLTIPQAKATQPDLVFRPLSVQGIHSAQEALFDVANSISPRVEERGSGRVCLDLSGTEALFPTERGLLTALAARLRDVGLEAAQLGIGPTRTVGELAARHRGGGNIIASGAVSRFLDPLPLDLLDPPEEISDRLTRWGVRTLGELSRLPRQALGSRLGETGVHLARQAHGEDLGPFQSTPPRFRFEEGSDPGYAVGNLETLTFLLSGVIDRLIRRLHVRGLAVRELFLELTLETGKTCARKVGIGAPTLEGSVLTSLTRLTLEKDPPNEPVERLRLIATPGTVQTSQLDLFLPPLPAPAELAVTVARLESLCGPDQVGAAGLADTHRLDQSHTESFPLTKLEASSVRETPLPYPTLALRALRPPHAVRVWQQNGLPERIELPASGTQQVTHRAGPWRLFGEWWGESRFARDYFDTELSDGGVYRLYRNLEDDSWFVDGIYD